MQFFVRTGLIFISQALSRAQMFPIVLITARGAGTPSQKERPASSLWAAPSSLLTLPPRQNPQQSEKPPAMGKEAGTGW